MKLRQLSWCAGVMAWVLKELKVDENTLVFFSSDNGPVHPFDNFFDSAGGLRGIKRSMYEGGLREPMIARWPGHVPAGKSSDEPWVFYDFLPTMAELTGAKVPEKVHVDGISVLPALLGGEMPRRECLYFELHEGPTIQAVRIGDMKAVKNGPKAKVELYDLKADPREQHDLAGERPDVATTMAAKLAAEHVEDPNWPTRAAKGKAAAE